MLLVPRQDGHVAVAQPAHGLMCGQLARAWGNERFGQVTPAAEVILAAEQHDDGWIEWERAPTLDRGTGLPHTFATAPFTVHLRIHPAWSRTLAAKSRYAALLVSLHHASFFSRPSWVGRLRADGRRISAFLDDLDALADELRRSLATPEPAVQRNRRLVRAWDGLSHDVLLGLAPRTRQHIPTADGVTDIQVLRDGEVHTVDPWPFARPVVTLRTEGRLLRGTFTDEEVMRAELAAAPSVELVNELRAP